MNAVRIIILIAAAQLMPGSLLAFGDVTLYIDGAGVQQRKAAAKGYLEITLHPKVDLGSLRIFPADGSEILRVVTSPIKL